MEWLRESFERERPAPVNPMKQALAMHHLLNTPGISSRADIAEHLRISRARVTQTLNLLRLSPKIQSFLLDLPNDQICAFTERRLRPISQILNPDDQMAAFKRICSAQID